MGRDYNGDKPNGDLKTKRLLRIIYLLIITVGIIALAALVLSAWILGLIYQEPERFLCDVTSCPLSLPQKSLGLVTEETISQCMQNCTDCIKGNPNSFPGLSRGQAVCRESCVCCENYQRCLDLGGSVESCVENLRECKGTPPNETPPFSFPTCDLVGRELRKLCPCLAAPLVQACIDMGAQVTLPQTGGCCRNATNTCIGGLTSFECVGIYGGDSTTCPISPCT